MTVSTAGGLVEAVLVALGGVRDPELDESITSLDFVAGLEIEGREPDADGVTVALALRLPTYFCASNFAYLMMADAEVAIRSVPGVAGARVTLVDHYAADEINAGVAAGQGFAGTFPGLADGELDELRTQFRRKAVMARQDRLCRALVDEGRTPEELAAMILADLPPGPETEAYVERRAELGMDNGPGSALLVDEEGRAVPPGLVGRHLRRARTQRASIEGNAAFCRGLLGTRYGLDGGLDGTEVVAVPVGIGSRARSGSTGGPG